MWRWRHRGEGVWWQVVGQDQRRPTPPGKQWAIRPSSPRLPILVRDDPIPLSLMGWNETHYSLSGGRRRWGEDGVQSVTREAGPPMPPSRFSCHIRDHFCSDRTSPPSHREAVGGMGGENATNARVDRTTMPSFFRLGTTSHFYLPISCHLITTSHSSFRVPPRFSSCRDKYLP